MFFLVSVEVLFERQISHVISKSDFKAPGRQHCFFFLSLSISFCLRPNSEAVAEGLRRHILPSPHFTEFPEKVNDK
jgi:hypothetical protein